MYNVGWCATSFHTDHSMYFSPDFPQPSSSFLPRHLQAHKRHIRQGVCCLVPQLHFGPVPRACLHRDIYWQIYMVNSPHGHFFRTQCAFFKFSLRYFQTDVSWTEKRDPRSQQCPERELYWLIIIWITIAPRSTNHGSSPHYVRCCTNTKQKDSPCPNYHLSSSSNKLPSRDKS